MKITKRQLRQMIRESLLVEAEMQNIIVNEYEDVDIFNRIANYALTNDIAGALADPEVNTDELYYDLDAIRPWIKRVGDVEWMGPDAVTPEGWNPSAVRKFMDDLNDAWHDESSKKDTAAIASDPDKLWLEIMASAWGETITPDDLETLSWKGYKNYIRLSPPQSISHGVDEVHVTNDDLAGKRKGFEEFLTRRAGKKLKNRKHHRLKKCLNVRHLMTG